MLGGIGQTGHTGASTQISGERPLLGAQAQSNSSAVATAIRDDAQAQHKMEGHSATQPQVTPPKAEETNSKQEASKEQDGLQRQLLGLMGNNSTIADLIVGLAAEPQAQVKAGEMPRETENKEKSDAAKHPELNSRSAGREAPSENVPYYTSNRKAPSAEVLNARLKFFNDQPAENIRTMKHINISRETLTEFAQKALEKYGKAEAAATAAPSTTTSPSVVPATADAKEVETTHKNLEVISQEIYTAANTLPQTADEITAKADDIKAVMRAFLTHQETFEILQKNSDPAYAKAEKSFDIPKGVTYEGVLDTSRPPHNQWGQAMEKWFSEKYPDQWKDVIDPGGAAARAAAKAAKLALPPAPPSAVDTSGKTGTAPPVTTTAPTVTTPPPPPPAAQSADSTGSKTSADSTSSGVSDSSATPSPTPSGKTDATAARAASHATQTLNASNKEHKAAVTNAADQAVDTTPKADDPSLGDLFDEVAGPDDNASSESKTRETKSDAQQTPLTPRSPRPAVETPNSTLPPIHHSPTQPQPTAATVPKLDLSGVSHDASSGPKTPRASDTPRATNLDAPTTPRQPVPSLDLSKLNTTDSTTDAGTTPSTPRTPESAKQRKTGWGGDTPQSSRPGTPRATSDSSSPAPASPRKMDSLDQGTAATRHSGVEDTSELSMSDVTISDDSDGRVVDTSSTPVAKSPRPSDNVDQEKVQTSADDTDAAIGPDPRLEADKVAGSNDATDAALGG